METTTSPANGNTPSHIVFIELLRGIASLIVVWDHLVAIWGDSHAVQFLPLYIVREYITKPLGIIQDFGYFGVAIFFFVSGFIITYVAQREQRTAFIVKRVLRIYPPLIASIFLIVATSYIYTWATQSNSFADIRQLNWRQILFSMTLWNYFFLPQNVVNGVAWSLVIEEIFYAISFILLPWLKSQPRVVSLACSIIVLVIIRLSRALGDNFFLFAASSAYIPLLLIGQATFFRWSGRITQLEFGALLLLNYGLFVYGLRHIHVNFYPVTNSYAVSTMYAYLLFVIALLLNDRIVIPRILKFYSKISYSMYLNHGHTGSLLLTIMYPYIGFSAALVVAFSGVTAISYASWRYIERPFQLAARAMLEHWHAFQLRERPKKATAP